MKKKVLKGFAALATAGTIIGSVFGVAGCGVRQQKNEGTNVDIAQASQEIKTVPGTYTEAVQGLRHSLNDLADSGIAVKDEVKDDISQAAHSFKNMEEVVEERETLWNLLDQYKTAAQKSKGVEDDNVVHAAQKSAAIACIASGANNLLKQSDFFYSIESQSVFHNNHVLSNLHTGCNYSKDKMSSLTQTEVDSNGLSATLDSDAFTPNTKSAFMSQLLKETYSYATEAEDFSYSDSTLSMSDKNNKYAISFDGKLLKQTVLHLDKNAQNGKSTDMSVTVEPITEQEYVAKFQEWQKMAEKSNSEQEA